MHLRVLIGLLLALACAGGASLSGLWKAKGVAQTKDVDIRHPLQSAAALFRSKWFVIGWIAALVAWLLHVGALALAPVSLGQAVIAGGLVSLGILAERFFGFQMNRRQWLGLLVIASGMAALAITAHSEQNHSSFGILEIISFEVAAIVIGVGCVITCRVERLRAKRGVLLGIAAGSLFGVSDISIKAVTSGAHGLLGALGPWTFVGIFAGLVAFYASARSLQIGNAVAVIAATASAANLLGIIGGIVVFREPLGNDIPTVVGRVAAFILVVVAVAIMPAPVRAQRAVRDQESEDEQSVGSEAAASDRGRLPAAARREAHQPAIAGGRGAM
jgi:drug/metabolite transporter (DMT)-like permease